MSCFFTSNSPELELNVTWISWLKLLGDEMFNLRGNKVDVIACILLAIKSERCFAFFILIFFQKRKFFHQKLFDRLILIKEKEKADWELSFIYLWFVSFCSFALYHLHPESLVAVCLLWNWNLFELKIIKISKIRNKTINV